MNLKLKNQKTASNKCKSIKSYRSNHSTAMSLKRMTENLQKKSDAHVQKFLRLHPQTDLILFIQNEAAKQEKLNKKLNKLYNSQQVQESAIQKYFKKESPISNSKSTPNNKNNNRDRKALKFKNYVQNL